MYRIIAPRAMEGHLCQIGKISVFDHHVINGILAVEYNDIIFLTGDWRDTKQMDSAGNISVQVTDGISEMFWIAVIPC